MRSNTVLDGYWEQPDTTAEALEAGWFHTGDGGTYDNGYLTISDRRKDVIITGGENVSSIEVEDAIFSHPGGGRGGRHRHPGRPLGRDDQSAWSLRRKVNR